jgi:hypothetical protein
VSGRIAVGITLLLVAGIAPAVAVPCATPLVVPIGNVVGEVDLDTSTLDPGDLTKAIGDWQNACPQYGTGFPSFVPNGTKGIPVSVTFHNGASTLSGGNCGETSMQYSKNGNVIGGTVVLYATQANGAACQPLWDVFAHELGHVLGEADATSAACDGHIMGAPTVYGQPRTIGSDDCSDVASLWTTPSEVQQPSPPPSTCTPPCSCPATCTTGCDTSGNCIPASCASDPSQPQCDPCGNDPTSPGCGGDGGGGGDTPCDSDHPCADVIGQPTPIPPIWRQLACSHRYIV